MEKESLLERVENSSKLMQGLFGSSKLSSRKDLLLLDNLLFKLIDGELPSDKIID